MVVMCKVNPKTNMLTFITVKDRQVFKNYSTRRWQDAERAAVKKRYKSCPLFTSAKQ